MARDYHRFMALIQSTIWLIEPNRAQVILDALEARVDAGPRAEPFLTEGEAHSNQERAVVRRYPMPPKGKGQTLQQIAVIPLFGTVLPRGNVKDMSGGGDINLMKFQAEFRQAANDPDVGAIILEFDTPGGDVTQVPETADLIRSHQRADRPIIGMANGMACSAGYWLAAACDEISATPTSQVGSIGVFQLHQNLEERAKMEGVKMEYIFEGPRKVEGNPFQPMGDEARANFQKSCRSVYEAFTGQVAKLRGAKLAQVQADPEAGGKHFGGGRAYRAMELEEMGLVGKGGMIDRVETMQVLVDRLMGHKTPKSRKTSTTKGRLALL